MTDSFRLQRFLEAQEGVHGRALEELRAGRKQSHWMWFIFPQLKGLGHSPTAQFFSIGSLEEARAYLAHPVLGERLRSATRAAVEADAASLHDLFGSPDDMKFGSSMTLFAEADPDESIFQDALDRWCAGRRDPRTLELLRVS